MMTTVVKNIKVLVLGGNSALAQAFVAVGSEQSNWQISCSSRTPGAECYLDLADVENVSAALSGQEFDVCLVFAAITNIAQCEQNPQLAHQVNCDAIITLMEVLNVRQWIVLSSNQVFSGSQTMPTRDTPTNPLTVYGKTKAAMENACIETGKPVAVLRLTKVLHEQMPLFRTFISQLCKGQSIEVFDNMFMAPVMLSDVTQFMVNLVNGFRIGTYHLSACNDLSYYQSLKYLAKLKNLNPALVKRQTTELVCSKNTSLMVDNLERSYGFTAKPTEWVIAQTFGPVFEVMTPDT